MTAHVAQRLRDAAAELPSGRVSLESLAQAHGSAAHGSLLLLMAIPCVLPVPGVGTVLGLGLVAWAAAMWRGDAVQCLPDGVAKVEMSRHWAQRVLRLLASTYAVAGRLAKARFMHLAFVGKRSWIAVAVGLMAVIIVLPIPFGNLLPALATVIIAIGLVFRDGVAIVIGLATAGLALVATAALVALAWILGSEWIAHLMLP